MRPLRFDTTGTVDGAYNELTNAVDDSIDYTAEHYLGTIKREISIPTSRAKRFLRLLQSRFRRSGGKGHETPYHPEAKQVGLLSILSDIFMVHLQR